MPNSNAWGKKRGLGGKKKGRKSNLIEGTFPCQWTGELLMGIVYPKFHGTPVETC